VTPGRLYGVGVGPGDPELLTLRAVELIKNADVVAYHSGPRGVSIARAIVDDHVGPAAIEELLAYPVTVGEATDYYAEIAEFYDASAERLAGHLDAGRDVVVLAEGDPLFYSSYMYLHDRLAHRYEALIVPGVTSVSAASAAARQPLVRHEDVLTVLPGTLAPAELTRRLRNTDAVAIMKLGRTFPAVRAALESAGRLDQALYIERASTGAEQVRPVADVEPGSVPYFSMIMVPGADRRADVAGRAERGTLDPELFVIGLGPGPDRWVTPEVAAVLDDVEHVVGYGPYVDRAPDRPGLLRHRSGNTVEVDRAREALDLALSGARVAVVSGGDAGVFGMAAAVFEAAQDERYNPVRITVRPGLSAMLAVAARAGAPLGGDFAVLSLSDRLKPWSVIETRLRAVAEADLVIAIYNPASQSRTTQVKQAKEVLLDVRAADTPVVIGRDIGRDGEDLTVTTLGDLDPDAVDMRCLLIIGASRTRVDRGAVWTPRFVG
jgi:precorrin-2 C20-methyltransferase/precorrin-3B C17-methyltransferase